MDAPYLVVDDRDGKILAELSAEEALQLLAELDPGEEVSLVRLDSGGGLVHHDSMVVVHPLFPNPPTSPRKPAP